MNFKKIFSLFNISLFINACVLVALLLLLSIFCLSRSAISVSNADKSFMDLAFSEAMKAKNEGSYPVGAVIVVDGKVVAQAHNIVAASGDTRDHAEMIAISEALKVLKLDDFSQFPGQVVLYTTYEPCPMCEGYIIWKKVDRVVVGKRKGIRELFGDNIASRLNYRLNMRSGLLEFKHDELVK